MEVDAMKKKLEASEATLAEVQNSLRYRNSELEELKESISKLEQLTDDNKGKGNLSNTMIIILEHKFDFLRSK
jgi:peptidoglycan hydrolase CwlO-like protein